MIETSNTALTITPKRGKGRPLGILNEPPPAVCIINKERLIIRFLDLYTFKKILESLQKTNGLELFVETDIKNIPAADPVADPADIENQYPVNPGIKDHWNGQDDYENDDNL